MKTNNELIYLLSTNKINQRNDEEYYCQPVIDSEGEIISYQDFVEKNRY